MVCHTGQHYDDNMSRVFFDQLELPEPDYYLGIGSGSHAEQTGRVMIEFEKVLLRESPDLIIVVGDVNSTIACSLVASKLQVPVAHVEAGLRSFDRTMPEEINRLLTDSIADFLFVTERSGLLNLNKEGIPDNRIFFVGNVMIDSLMYLLPKSLASTILGEIGLHAGGYAVATFHRPSNVDSKERLEKIIAMLTRLSEDVDVVFPVHPRTRANVDRFGFGNRFSPRVHLSSPLGYIDFLALVKDAAFVLTDSGGIQEETTYLGVPCITLRNSTERPITVDQGTNHLVGIDLQAAEGVARGVVSGGLRKSSRIPELWDGHAAERIAQILVERI